MENEALEWKIIQEWEDSAEVFTQYMNWKGKQA